MERNELCWCGSGKKYKKCHLMIEEKREKRKLNVLMAKKQSKVRQRKKSKKFFKNIYFVCLTFTLKKAISIVRGKNNTLPPLAQSRIRICK